MSAAQKIGAQNTSECPAMPHEVHQTIGIAKSLSPQQVIELVCETPFYHVVQQDGPNFEAEVQAAASMISSPSRFLDAPIEVILGGSSSDASSRFLHSSPASEKKRILLAKFGEYLSGIKGTRAIWEQALMVADELYTNGSKNAWPKGGSLFEGEPMRAGTLDFFAQADTHRLILGCRDSFGELNIDSVLERIRKCMVMGVAEAIRQGTGGAGIGSYMVFDACLGYYAGSEAGKRSVVCVSMPIGMSRRSMAGLPKNIHLLA